MGFASTSQIQQAHSLGSRRNACRILNDMSPYLNVFRDKENIYYLNKKGANRIGLSYTKDKTMQYKHYLLRNDLYLHYNMPDTWENEVPIRVGLLQAVADAAFEKDDKLYFVEVDNMQKMNENEKKIERYKRMKDTGKIQEKLGYFPILVWVTQSEVRKKKLIALCNNQLLKSYVFTSYDIS